MEKKREKKNNPSLVFVPRNRGGFSALGVRRGRIQQTPNVAFEFGRLWTEVTTGCGIVIFGGSAKLGERRRRDVALEERESPRKGFTGELVARTLLPPPSFVFFLFFPLKPLREPPEKGCSRARDPGEVLATRVAKGDALVTVPWGQFARPYRWTWSR